MKNYIKHVLIFTMVIASITVQAQKEQFRFKNQISTWTTINIGTPISYQTGGRYVPAFSISDSLKKNRLIDAELSLNTYGNLLFTGSRYDSASTAAKFYRFWLRYSGQHLEIRIGLQKIDFGSSSILRPLMWFDKMDFRDPLQLTDGVYGILGRYYFQKNVNIWLWLLYGENKTKGWEVAPTLGKTPEYGGRLQIPVSKGEMGISFHHRETDFSSFYLLFPHVGETHYPENRIGLDGKWDIGPGIWYEYVVKKNDPDNGIIKKWETYFNIGLDYTFNIGNGINFTTEFFRYSNKDKWSWKGTDNSYSAFAVNYPFALLNRITGMVYYNWSQKEWYRFINLERKYDYWSFYLMAFWNPERFSLYNASEDRNLMAGKGIQLMAVVNF